MPPEVRRKARMGRLGSIRRDAVAAVGVVWLAGFHFFHDGFYHMAAFWWLLAPLAVANADLLAGGDRRWRGMLILLVAWQLGCGLVRREGGWPAVAAMLDVVAVGVLVVTVLGISGRDRGWPVLRLAMVVAAAGVSLWSLVRFYPLAGLGLEDERLRNVLVYPTGLNAVLTGLLAGFSLLAGFELVGRESRWRWPLYGALSVLAFALMATQARGAMLATLAGAAVMVACRGRKVLPEVAACVAGTLAYLVAFALADRGAAGPDLLERGATGRVEIWKTYLGRLEGGEWWIGTGRVPPLDESVLGWLVHHPHGSWVSQIVWCGLPGLLLLAVFLGLAAVAGWRVTARDATPLALLVFGVTGLVFDGAQVVSLASAPRIEPLLVLVPALVALRMRERRSDEVGPA